MPRPSNVGASLHLDLELADVGELDGVVLAGGDRLAEVEPDLGGVDVERGDEVDVAHVVVAEDDVHEARHVLGGVGVAVVLDALDEAARAVPDSGDGDADATTHDAGAPSVWGGLIGSTGRRARWARAAFGRDQRVDPLEVSLGGLGAVLEQGPRVAVTAAG